MTRGIFVLLDDPWTIDRNTHGANENSIKGYGLTAIGRFCCEATRSHDRLGFGARFIQPFFLHHPGHHDGLNTPKGGFTRAPVFFFLDQEKRAKPATASEATAAGNIHFEADKRRTFASPRASRRERNRCRDRFPAQVCIRPSRGADAREIASWPCMVSRHRRFMDGRSERRRSVSSPVCARKTLSNTQAVECIGEVPGKYLLIEQRDACGSCLVAFVKATAVARV